MSSSNAIYRTFEDVRDEALAPHARLMLAVLEEAMMSLQVGMDSKDPRKRRLGQEASEWFRSRDFDSLFSFENVCSVLGLDSGYIRAGIRRMKMARIQSPVPMKVMRVRRAYGGQETKPLSLSAGAA